MAWLKGSRERNKTTALGVIEDTSLLETNTAHAALVSMVTPGVSVINSIISAILDGYVVTRRESLDIEQQE